MRRLVLEISQREFNKIDPENPLRQVKSIKILHLLRFDRQEVAIILRAEFKKPNVSIEDVLNEELIEVQLLQQEGDKISTYFIKAKPPESEFAAAEGYFSLPYEVTEGKVKITFLGSTKQVREFVKLFEDASIRYRVISITDARFPPHSPLSSLTEKQRRALITAHNLGYYDVPKKINLVHLAKRLNLASSTVDVQLRRAERRLLNHIMNES
jgi:hypothetical protein